MFSIIVPIFLIIGIGVLLDKSFELDLSTLSKLSFYVFVPALIFLKIVESELPGDQMISVLIFGLVYNIVIFSVAFGIFSIPALREKREILTIGTWLSNIGNYGIPLITFIFGTYIDVVALMIMLQILLTFTFGLWFIQKGTKTLKDNLKQFMKNPIIYTIIVAFLIRGIKFQLPSQITDVLNYLGNSLVPVVLLTLGIQLSRTKLIKDFIPVVILIMMRLCIAPFLAFLIISVIPFGFTDDIKTLLIILAGTPVAVNVMMLALEYERNAEFASQIVFWTTLLSSVSISVLLLILN